MDEAKPISVCERGARRRGIVRLAVLLLVVAIVALTALSGPSEAGSVKKGVGLWKCFTPELTQKLIMSLDVSWYYNWGFRATAPANSGAEFVPMVWRSGRVFDEGMPAVQGSQVLLGFNEPDQRRQADMSVDEAISLWPKLSAAAGRIGSPAPAHALAPWMRSFMQEAEAARLKIDFVAVHWYGKPRPQALLRFLARVHAAYNRPIWLTEFAVANWKSQTGVDPAIVQGFMREVIPQLEALPYVERYAWYSSACRRRPAMSGSFLFDKAGNLTELGRIYAGF